VLTEAGYLLLHRGIFSVFRDHVLTEAGGLLLHKGVWLFVFRDYV
jgi:hypothetical protein